MYAHGMKCVIVVACILNSYCMNFAACWSNTTHVKACNMRAQGMQHVFCILLCLVCVCILAFWHALVRTWGLFWGDFVCVCILHALAMHSWAYFLHAQGCSGVRLLCACWHAIGSDMLPLLADVVCMYFACITWCAGLLTVFVHQGD